MDKRIYLSSPHMSGFEEEYVKKAFDTNWVAPLGENVTLFEEEIQTFVGVKHACAVSSGTAALHLALDILGVGRDDIVFCSSLTFAASAFPITYLGAVPVFIDSELQTWNMSGDSLLKAFEYYKMLGKLPKAVIIVNLYGQSADMEVLLSICEKYDVPVIEDAAESLGAKYKGKNSGTFGTLSIFSFNGNKMITTSGGGMVVSDDEHLIQRALKKATQAREATSYYEHREVGYNYRLSNICAGIGCGQMKVLNERIEQKREIYSRYYENLSHVDGVIFMPELHNSFHTRWLSTFLVDPVVLNVSVSGIIEHLNKENIEARHVWKPMHMQPVFKNYNYFYVAEDISRRLFEQGICLPSDTKMTFNEIDQVSQLIKEYVDVSVK